MHYFRSVINKFNIKFIKWTLKDKVQDISDETIDRFIGTGLNNVDFITSDWDGRRNVIRI